jgi:hypothetical protein
MRLTERYEQLPMWPVYGVEDLGSDYPTLLEAAKALGRVTLDRAYKPFRYSGYWKQEEPMMVRWTVFREIEALPPGARGCGKVPDTLRTGPGTETAPVGKIASRALSALASAIVAIEDDRHYVMPHSAGYDSRLLSLLLKTCGYEAEQFTFVAWEPEEAYARQVVYAVWGSLVVAKTPAGFVPGDEDYFAPILTDFVALGSVLGDHGRWMGGFHWLAATHNVPEGFGMLSAIFADETMGYNRARMPSWGHFLAGRMMENPSPVATTTRDWIMPFVSVPWLEVLSTYDLSTIPCERNREEVRLYEWYSPSDTLKREMIRQLDESLLEIPNPRFALAKRTRPPHNEILPHTKLSRETRVRMRENVEGSYLQRCMPTLCQGNVPENVMDCYDPWLQQYQLAAIVEACVDAGVEVVA